MTSRYEKLQEAAREMDCSLTKVRPKDHAVRAPYYVYLKNQNTARPAFDLNGVARILLNEHRRQTNYWSKGHKDLMRNPLRD